MFQRIKSDLSTMRQSLAGPIRKHAHPHHQKPIDSYVRFIGALIRVLEAQEIQMTDIKRALDKVEAERDAWKNYGTAQKTKADQADRARQALQDQLNSLPLAGDTEDAAAVNGVIQAADDLPPADTGTTTTPPATDNTGGTPTPPTTAGDNGTPVAPQ